MIWWRERWRVNPVSLLLLGGMILVMLLIVALPDDLDLPDAAFHRGTAPVVLHSQATGAPAIPIIAVAVALLFTGAGVRQLYQQPAFSVHPVPNFLPIFLRVIRR